MSVCRSREASDVAGVAEALRWLLNGDATPDASGYRVQQKIPVSGDGGWDYLTVDNASRRLFVSHGTKVDVLDVDSGDVKGSIPDTPGVHGVAVVSPLGRGFISCGKAGVVKVFDLTTLKPVTEVTWRPQAGGC